MAGDTVTPSAPAQARKTRVVILGGGFGGVYTARHLEKLCKRRPDVDDRAGEPGQLPPHDAAAVRGRARAPSICDTAPSLSGPSCGPPGSARERCRASTWNAGGSAWRRPVERSELAYDQLVLALGALTNQTHDPRLGERLHVQDARRRPSAAQSHDRALRARRRREPDPERKRALLTFVIIGGGLVGVELFGELTAFMDAAIGRCTPT